MPQENTPTENVDPLKAIREKQNSSEAQSRAEIARLEDERIRIGEQRRPLGELQDKGALLVARITVS